MKDVPQKIYLQVLGDDETWCGSFNELWGVTWSTERINESDLEYILNINDENKNES